VDEESVSLGNSYSQRIKEKFKSDTVVIVSAEIEQQITELKDLEANEFMKDIGIKESGLDQIIKAGYKILNLTTYFTVGREETHAWTIEKNCKAPDAAEVIHSDFKKGFIKAEVISYIDYIRYAGEVGARDHGKLKIEGKDYEVADGDVLHFRFNT
jgi:ribosome-binding ATPase YchF (GTP1/OBG family)